MQHYASRQCSLPNKRAFELCHQRWSLGHRLAATWNFYAWVGTVRVIPVTCVMRLVMNMDQTRLIPLFVPEKWMKLRCVVVHGCDVLALHAGGTREKKMEQAARWRDRLARYCKRRTYCIPRSYLAKTAVLEAIILISWDKMVVSLWKYVRYWWNKATLSSIVMTVVSFNVCRHWLCCC